MASHAHPAGRIGPNAVIRLAEAATALEGAATATRVFRGAGLEHYLETPPEALVPEAEVAALQAGLRTALGDRRAGTAAWIAGQRTADYVIAHRIPPAVRGLLLMLPAAPASRLLLRAIAAHAWTFVGSGRLTIRPGRPVILSVADCPLCRRAHAPEPVCTFYAATFERLFARLVHPAASARETECSAAGGAACRFTIAW